MEQRVGDRFSVTVKRKVKDMARKNGPAQRRKPQEQPGVHTASIEVWDHARSLVGDRDVRCVPGDRNGTVLVINGRRSR